MQRHIADGRSPPPGELWTQDPDGWWRAPDGTQTVFSPSARFSRPFPGVPASAQIRAPLWSRLKYWLRH